MSRDDKDDQDMDQGKNDDMMKNCYDNTIYPKNKFWKIYSCQNQ